MKIHFFLLNVFGAIVNGNYAKVEYYVNLIKEETARAYTNQLPQDSSEFIPTSHTSEFYGEYDYVIVGAGSAGSVIANRLSEITGNGVLLLEAGGYESDFSDIPGMDIYLQGLEFNWNYNSTPQTTSCLAMINRECPYPRGKGLGGSSIINSLVYSRGNKKDYDKWCDEGNPGWSYKDVLPLFKKSENSRINGDRGFHGIGGNLNVEYLQPESLQFRAFIEANVELGRNTVDYNGAEQLGVSRVQFNTINGRRGSTAKSFLQTAYNRPNLEILIRSLVTKILLTEDKTAYGVQFTYNGILYVAEARKEVIISAGSIGSPQLLMLSGIGPKTHLNELGIPVVQSLSVGENLQDHPTYYDLHFSTNYTQPVSTLEEDVKEFLKGFGPLTFASNLQGLGFFQSKFEKHQGYPDIEIIQIPSHNTNDFIPRAFHYVEEYRENVFEKIDPSRSFSFEVIALRPKSRGTLKLRSRNPYEFPLIDLRLLSDGDNKDISTMYEGIKLGLEMMQTNAFKKLNASLIDTTMPACRLHQYLSRDYWYCQLKQLSFHIYHPVGTCKMGPDPKKGAVVNHELKVYGVRNLRVADASIMPQLISGHTNAATIMIGEKLACLLLNSRCKSEN